MTPIERFEQMLARGRDDALLRFSLGNAYLGAGDLAAAATHLQTAVRHDPDYSAAWKLLGRVLAEAGRTEEARAAFESGIAAADRRGDVQAGKEMRVFLRRLPPPG
ncbi:MAG: tetratricopeptide repeat protein [Candidatus Competibacterales bacterium]|nr:tetratricopeptide repeat protein [Candidatus Competibacterales bacterium]